MEYAHNKKLAAICRHSPITRPVPRSAAPVTAHKIRFPGTLQELPATGDARRIIRVLFLSTRSQAYPVRTRNAETLLFHGQIGTGSVTVRFDRVRRLLRVSSALLAGKPRPVCLPWGLDCRTRRSLNRLSRLRRLGW